MTSQRTFGALLGWMITLDLYTNAVSNYRSYRQRQYLSEFPSL